MKTKKKRTVWLARNTHYVGDEHAVYILFAAKPRWGRCDGGCCIEWNAPASNSAAMLGRYCAAGWERIVGFQLKPGTCRQVTISVQEVQE
jgi:hypothetical protein